MCAEFREFLKAEKNSTYSKTELEVLWDKAIKLRQSIDTSSFGDDLPFPLFVALRNIDLGAIKKSYRAWVIEDAEIVIDSIENNGFQLPS